MDHFFERLRGQRNMDRQNNIEDSERKEKTRAYLNKIQAQLEENFSLLKDIKEAPKKKEEETLQAIRESTLDVVHNENVKVYRNVQAVVVSETEKVSDSLNKMNERLNKKLNIAVIFSILAFAFAILTFAYTVLLKYGVL
ncbi:MAG: hypothetical protein K6A29_00905 [Lachnospiraceae bacterium]|nr:hypothetical protein [Lachnospiraceae bacterium]